MTRSLLSLIACLVLVASCKRGAEEPAVPPGEGSAQTAGHSGTEEAPEPVPSSVSPAPAREAAPSVVASRPDALIDALPGGAVMVGVDLDALAAWAAGGLEPEGAASRSRGVVETAVTTLLANVVPDASVRLAETSHAAAWSWDATGLALAVDAAPTELVGGVAETTGSVTVITFGAAPSSPLELPEGLPSSALATVVVGDVGALPERIAGSLDFLAPLGAQRIAASIGSDGAVDAVIEADEPSRIHTALGGGQAFVSQALGQLRMETLPSMQGWVTYANRLTQALFARVAVAVEEDRATLHVPAPSCGGPLRNLTAVAFVLAVADFAAADPRTPSIPYVAMDARFADDCGPVDGPAPAIAASAARFGTRDDSRRGVVVAADLPALLREGLPTAFGAVPFALPDSVILEAFGERPMGLAGLSDPAGLVVFARDRGEGATSPASQALILPASLAAFVDPVEPVDTMAPFVTPSLVGYATVGFEPTARAGEAAGAAWERAFSLVPEGALAVGVVNGAVVRSLADRMGAEDPLRPAVGALDSVLFVVTGDGLSVGFVGVPEGLEAEAVRGLLPGTLASISRTPGPGPREDQRLAAARDAVDVLAVRVQGDVLWLDANGRGVPLAAAAARIGLPLLAGISGRGHVGIPRAPQELPIRP